MRVMLCRPSAGPSTVTGKWRGEHGWKLRLACHAYARDWQHKGVVTIAAVLHAADRGLVEIEGAPPMAFDLQIPCRGHCHSFAAAVPCRVMRVLANFCDADGRFSFFFIDQNIHCNGCVHRLDFVALGPTAPARNE